MKPRITISVTKDKTIEIYLNPEGRDLLVRELLNLSERSDHFHLGPPGIGEVETSARAYEPTDEVFEYGKVLFRPDSWDEKHYPHVLAEGD